MADLQKPSGLAAALDEALHLHQQGRLRDAFERYGKILAQEPDNAVALHYSGVVLHQTGEHAHAIDLIQQSIRLDGTVAEAWANLAQALMAANRPQAAIDALKAAASRAPAQAEIWSNLAAAEVAVERYEDAEASARRAIAADAHHAAGWYNLALVLEPQGRVIEALDAASRAAARAPNVVAFAGLKAQFQQRLGQLEAARKTLQSAVARVPTATPLHVQIAAVAEESGDFAAAMQALETVLRLDPDNGGALSDLLFLRKRLCEWHDLPALRARFESGVDAGRPHLSPFVLLSGTSTRSMQRACAEAWSRQFIPASVPRRARRILSPGRLRIGYLSSDFFDHPTAMLTAGIFERHDRSRFEVFGYSTLIDDGSALRRRVAAAFDRFVEARNWPVERIVNQIRVDRIDILIDLKGHTAGAPTAVLAHRAAPIQAHYVGYPGTLGAPYVDYLIGDRIVTPLEHAADYHETLVQLPGSYQPNDGSRAASQPAPRQVLGLPPGAFVFCCFNNTFKLNPRVVDVWTKVLQGTPQSVLWLLMRGSEDPAITNVRREFGKRSIDPARIIFAHHRTRSDYLALYHHADLFLDSWPYNAHTTASDALWCGCPVVTWRGDTFAGRVAASLLDAVGLPELVATSVDEYVRLCIDLAAHRERLTRYRDYLLNQGRQSSLFDIQHKTRALEAAYEQMAKQFRSGVRSPIRIAGTPGPAGANDS